MAKSSVIGYGLAFGVGIGLGYMMFAHQTPPATAVPSTSAGVVGTRWTSGYHGSIANGFPEAGRAEALYGRNQMHKMTSFTPDAYGASMAFTNGQNGSIIYID